MVGSAEMDDPQTAWDVNRHKLAQLYGQAPHAIEDWDVVDIEIGLEYARAESKGVEAKFA